jgi:NodT family efflux transporter outer membrane factor (OMF) lipoprotein
VKPERMNKQLSANPVTRRRSAPVTLAAAAAATLLLASCASQRGIAPEASMAPVSNYASQRVLPAGDAAWPDVSWARAIGGDELVALIDEAVRGNPGLQGAAARVRAANALAASARAAAQPTIGGSAQATYQRFTEHGLIPPPLAGTYQTDSQVALNFNLDLDFWGRHEAELRQALAQGQVAAAEQQASRLVLAQAVARSWLQLARQQAQHELTGRQIVARQKLDQLAQLRYKAGLDARIDTEQARQQIALLRAEQAQWQEAMALTRNQLAALLGQGPDRGLSIKPGKLPEPAALALPAALPSGLLGRRPDIVAARWRVEAAQGEVDVARTQFYPTVNLTAFAGLSAFGLNNLIQPGSQILGVGPALRLPIFEGGALRANLQGRVGSYDAAVSSYNQSLVDALHEVADQVQALRGAEQQAKQLDTAADAAQKSWELAQAREKKGTTNMLPVLAAELNYLGQRKQEIDLQVRRADLQVGLMKALGGGYDAQAAGTQQASAQVTPSAASMESTPSKKSGS